jgi:hypothetical protein
VTVEVSLMSEDQEQSWITRAAAYSDNKSMNVGYFQALSLLAIAESIHRLAQAVEADRRQS